MDDMPVEAPLLFRLPSRFVPAIIRKDHICGTCLALRGAPLTTQKRSESYIQRPLPWVSAKSNWPSPRDVINFIASATEHTVPYPTLSESTPQLRQPVQPILDLSPAHSDHTQAICAALHPTEPSCLKHYLFALLRELKGAARFAGVLALVGALLRLKAGVRK